MKPVSFSYISVDRYYSGDSTTRYRKYLLDKNRIEYGADLVREAVAQHTSEIADSIQAASERQVEAIRISGNQVVSAIQENTKELASSIKEAEKAICHGLRNISGLLSSLNRRTDMMIEQQKMTNLLLGNIVDLLKIPDSEKERQQAISLGIKFFVNAHDQPQLYQDALDYLLKAEQLQPQDFFVLHRIGYLYLYVDYLLDPAKALQYFSRAARYAEAESSPNAIRIANILSNPINAGYISINSDPSKISSLAADSYEKAAFAAYIDNQIDKAIELQKRAIALDNQTEYVYNLSKYLAHKGETRKAIKQLEKAIESAPIYAVAVFQDRDFIMNREIVRWVRKKNESVDDRLRTIILKTKDPDIAETVKWELKSGSYISKCRIMRRVLKLDKTLHPE